MIGADRREYFCRAASICPAELRVMPLFSMLLICHVNLNASITIYSAFGTYIRFLPPFPMVREALFRPPQHSLPPSSTIPALFKSLIKSRSSLPSLPFHTQDVESNPIPDTIPIVVTPCNTSLTIHTVLSVLNPSFPENWPRCSLCKYHRHLSPT